MTNTYGAIISIIASILSNIGTNVQKEAHIRNDALPKDKQTSYVKQPLWWFGITAAIKSLQLSRGHGVQVWLVW